MQFSKVKAEPSLAYVGNKAQKCEMTCPRSHPKLRTIKGPESRFPQLNLDSTFYHTSEKVVLVIFLDTYNL